MKKLKLNLDEIKVESFVTVKNLSIHDGTVHGHNDSNLDPTCEPCTMGGCPSVDPNLCTTGAQILCDCVTGGAECTNYPQCPGTVLATDNLPGCCG